MNYALEIQQLHKTYDNGFTALKGISLKVQEGDFFALLGPNGAGKSSTLGVVSSLVNKTQGKVSIFGHDLDGALDVAKRLMGIVPQEFNFNAFEKVQDIIIQQAGYYGIERRQAQSRCADLLRQLGLWDKREQAARTLSGGMKRRLMIARALVHQPKLLILDEPTAGVDIELRRSMWDFLRHLNAQGTTIILTTHYLEEAENLCRNIAIIDHGDIVENTSMKALLRQLNTETFILDLAEEVGELPAQTGYSACLLNPHQLQVTINKEQSLNEVFTALSAMNVHVTSMRNKTNRLEELFVSLVQGNHSELKGV